VDSWCTPVFSDGKWLYGAAAREVRIAALGGSLDRIIQEAGAKAARIVVEFATRAAEPANDAQVVVLHRISR
jgi:hypothetical protein